MNKKELQIIATEEQRLYLCLKYAKRSAKHFFNTAVKYRKAGNAKQAKIYWGYCKNACKDAENAFDDVKKNVPFSFVWAVKKTVE